MKQDPTIKRHQLEFPTIKDMIWKFPTTGYEGWEIYVYFQLIFEPLRTRFLVTIENLVSRTFI